MATYPADGQFDPALFAGNTSDIQIQAQVLEKLVTLAPDMSVEPTLATNWESSDNIVWKFTLRDGVTFTNGDPFTSADVVYTMHRLMSKKLGSSMASVYSNIKSVTADDASHVTFTLKAPDSEFPASLADYHTLMLDKNVKDPTKNWSGTGPFVLKSSTAESRAVLHEEPSLLGQGRQGNPMPYLDEVEFIYTPTSPASSRASKAGPPTVMMPIARRRSRTLDGNPNVKTVERPTNYCFELQIRTDQEPGSNAEIPPGHCWPAPIVKAIVDLVAPGVAAPGNGTLVGPAYKATTSTDSVPYDPAKAKQLLADAGYANGVTIKLVDESSDPLPADRHGVAGADEEDRHQRIDPAGPAGRVLRGQGHRQLVSGDSSSSSTTARRLHPSSTSAGADQRCGVELLALEEPGIRRARQADRFGRGHHEATPTSTNRPSSSCRIRSR